MKARSDTPSSRSGYLCLDGYAGRSEQAVIVVGETSLPEECWMDEDNRHVWWAHDCVKDGQRVRLMWMLPHPHWRKDEGDSPTVQPSIVCEVPGCGFHSSPFIGKPPSDWRPRMTRAELESSAATDGGSAT